jgi:hypothetical protein
MRKAFVLAGAIAATLSVQSIAQPDYTRRPSFGTLNLQSGFLPDPRIVPVTAGGQLDAGTISPGCLGSVANAPDVRVNYTAGSLPLIFSVASAEDTTLVINGPDGRWYCDDDGGEQGLNPAIRFNTPQSGQYDVYIGHYGQGRRIPARLHISEVGSQ